MFYNFIIIFFPILLGVIEFVWYLTCTKHEDIPLILVILDLICLIIPILGFILALFNIFILYELIDVGNIELKNNWFNKTFLAYNAE